MQTHRVVWLRSVTNIMQLLNCSSLSDHLADCLCGDLRMKRKTQSNSRIGLITFILVRQRKIQILNVDAEKTFQ